jgi:hypothetical protein
MDRRREGGTEGGREESKAAQNYTQVKISLASWPQLCKGYFLM